MGTTMRRRALNSANSVLGMVDLELIRIGRRHQDFIPHRDTLLAAEKAGLSLGDYIDNSFNVPGATQLTIDKMTEMGVFDQKIETVCEIGPGSGRYLEKTKSLCHPESYEIYETAVEWRDWLAKKYQVTAHKADGVSLAQTPSGSIDLVHSHKVFTGLRFVTILGYFREMIRVTRDGGRIVFDVMTEDCFDDCFDDKAVENWLDPAASWANCMFSKRFITNFFTTRGLGFEGSFLIPMKPGITQYFVFNKS